MSAAPASAALPLVLALPNYPLSVADRPSTEGVRYLDNLRGRLEALPKVETPHTRAVRAGVLYQRYQVLGSLADLDQAYTLSQQLAADPAADTDTLVLAATIASYMHEFDGALMLLDRVPEVTAADMRQEIANARSQPPLATPRQELSAGKEYAQLLEMANVCVDRGDLDCASRHFHGAQFAYHDVAPLPLAWLHTQQGIALLRFGHPEAAIAFFRSALERLPGYYLALEHLAECLALTGHYAEGRSAYQQVIAQTANPEYMAGLADLEKRAGNPRAAAQMRERAKLGYAERLAKFPSAYAQHAVGFYLEIGDLVMAAKLAQDNIKLRQDASAYLLLAEVKLANHDLAGACAAVTPVRASGRHPPELMDLEKLLPSCTTSSQPLP